MIQIKITDFQNHLEDDFVIVETIWGQIEKEGFSIRCLERLEPNETPVDTCTDLEKMLLACITLMEHQKRMVTKRRRLEKRLIKTIRKEHKISRNKKVAIKGLFFIVTY